MSTFDYDIIASFPSIARDLVDIRYCEWVKSSEYQAQAIYGYVRCMITIYKRVKVSPIIQVEEDGSLITPTGTWETYLTKGELDFIKKWKIGKYKILEGWWAISTHKDFTSNKTKVGEYLAKPLAEPMDKLLAYKERTGLQANLAKRMSVGIYGKFGEERRDTFGPYFNPCYFAEISTQVRLKVAEWIYKNKLQDSLLHVSVDGVLLDKRVKGFKPTKYPKSKNGYWKLNSITSALIVSSGLVFHADKKPKGLSLSNVLRLIKEHPRVGYYEKKIRRRVTLGDALAMSRFEDLGKEVYMTSSIDLYRLEHDREFRKLPKSGEQLLNNHYKSKSRRI